MKQSLEIEALKRIQIHMSRAEKTVQKMFYVHIEIILKRHPGYI
jgi:hypothetical protein